MEKKIKKFFAGKSSFIHLLPFIIIVVSLFFAVQPLFHAGFFPIHDDEQVGRLFELNKDITAEEIPPRLAQDLGFGYDYPFFNFYPSFVYYVAEIFHLFGFSYIVSIKLMIGLGFVLAAVFMYFFAKEYAGRIGGVVASVAYSYSMYHSVDIYVRGALPEFFFFAAVPLLFFVFLKIAKTQKFSYAVLAGIVIACALLTHNLLAMMSAIFLGIYIIFLFFQVKDKKLFVLHVFISGILGLCLSAYFWIPAIFENKYTMVNLLTSQLANYNLHFVCPKQFLNSPWGYGGSLLGCDDGLSFQIGQIHIVLLFITGAAAFWAFVKNKVQKIHTVFLLFLFMFAISLFMQIQKSSWFWDHLPPFWYIQFPWRFLEFSAFTIAFLIGLLFVFLKNNNVRIAAAVVAVAALIFFNKDYFVPSKYLAVSDTAYVSLNVLNWRTSAMAFEYTPKGIKTKTSSIGNTIIAVDQNGVAKSPFTVTQGTMAVVTQKDTPAEKDFAVVSPNGGVIRLSTFSFPGWKVFVDGKQIAYSDNNDLKLITISVPSGSYSVRAVFTNTILRTIGNSLSAVTFILLFIYGVWFFIKRKYAA